nr:wiskott-Aldrich syndrome protein homolog isoform X1 [Hydra vulgaris]
MKSCQPKKPQEVNRPSNFLSEDENSLVFNLIGEKCVTLSTTIVQAFTSGIGECSWQKLCDGVICFVKDDQKYSYYIRVFELGVNQLVFEQDIKNLSKCKTLKECWHAFKVDNLIVGLEFIDPQEANHFLQIIKEKLRAIEEQKTGEDGFSNLNLFKLFQFYDLP